MYSKLLLSGIAALVLTSNMTACSTSPTRQQVGIGAGAVIGGVAGSAVSNGSALGTVGGAVVGGVIGNELTKPK